MKDTYPYVKRINDIYSYWSLTFQNMTKDERNDEIAQVLKDYASKSTIHPPDEINLIRIDDLDISIRSHSLLKNHGFRFLNELKSWELSDFKKLRNCTSHTVKELTKIMAEHNMCWK